MRELWHLGLSLWAARNKGEHGSGGGPSLEDKDNVLNLIQEFYKHIKPIISPQDSWLFQKSEKIKIMERYEDQIAWVDAVCRVYKTNIQELDLTNAVTHVGQQQYRKIYFL